MTNRFMMSVAAAALIAGTGLANAQGSPGSAGAPSSERASAGAAGRRRSAVSGLDAAAATHRPACDPASSPVRRRVKAPASARQDERPGPEVQEHELEIDPTAAWTRARTAEDRSNRDDRRQPQRGQQVRRRASPSRPPARPAPRGKLVDRAAHQDHHRDQEAEDPAGHQRQLHDLGRHPGARDVQVPPASAPDRRRSIRSGAATRSSW